MRKPSTTFVQINRRTDPHTSRTSMVGIVIVSYSRNLALGVQELANQMVQAKVPIAIAAGIDNPDNPLGTDPLHIQQAIESVDREDGVIVLMDLGSAILSAEMALKFLEAKQRQRVRLCNGPLVEGAIAAAVSASTGASLEQVCQAANQALNAKQAQLFPNTQQTAQIHLTLLNSMGLHARPAAKFVTTAAEFDCEITLRNLTRNTQAVNGKSINQVITLGARQGDEIAITATGEDASEALTQLKHLVETHFGETFPESPPPSPSIPTWIEDSQHISGIPASQGIAIAPLYLYRATTSVVQHQHTDYPDIEWDELQLVVETAQQELKTLQKQTSTKAGEQQAAIFAAHSLYLSDPVLLEDVKSLIFEQHLTAAAAWKKTIDRTVTSYEALEDADLQARAADVADVGERVLRLLTGTIATRIELPEPVILVTNDLTPSQTAQLDINKVLGICTVGGSATSHSGILARSLGIPAIVGVGSQLLRVKPGTRIAMDGETGEVWIHPDETELRQLEQKWQAQTHTPQIPPPVAAREPAITRDGHRVKVMANIASLADAKAAVDLGAEGIGLLRSEFLFLDRVTLPTEEEQLEIYQAIAAAVAPHPLIIRVFDAGGDKPLPYLNLPAETNPFLGYRGIRILLDRLELLKTQLRAILRASDRAAIKVMFPMVSGVKEVRAIQQLIASAKTELQQENLPFDRQLEIGITIEVPAAVNMSDRLAGEVNFFSIGTNDLTQYVMASDRTNVRVAKLADAFEPAILRSIQQTITNAHRAGIRVGVCGEFASYREAIPILVGLGVDELSMNASAIAGIKTTISQLSWEEAGAIASAVLHLDSAEAVREYVASRFSPKKG